MLAFERSGCGDPLVLIHPLGADRGVWGPVLPALTRDFDCIAFDMPGFGESPALPAEIVASPGALANAVLEALDGLGVESFHVAGISLGAWVALELGKTGRASSVTAFCSAGFWPRPLTPRRGRARRIARALWPALPSLLRSSRVREAVLAGTMAHPERVPADAALRLVRSYVRAPGFDRANAEMRGSVFSGFDEIAAPVTFVWAEHDRLVQPPLEAPGGAPTVLLRGAGHVPTWDEPERMAELIGESAANAATANSLPLERGRARGA